MDNTELKVTHLFHSGFMMETVDKLLIFDYFKSPYLDINESILNSKKDVFVFVTHGHGDHYNPEIFQWEKLASNITYILSSDINFDEKNYNYFIMDKYEAIDLENFSIESYGTTDSGTSFLVETNGFTIFHGGDLNWWKWKKDSQEVQLKEELDFKREIDRLIGRDIDIAFIPVDPRLEEYYYLAGEYAAETLKPKLLVPMHFNDNYNICKDFKKQIQDTKISSAVIDKNTLSFIYKK